MADGTSVVVYPDSSHNNVDGDYSSVSGALSADDDGPTDAADARHTLRLYIGTWNLHGLPTPGSLGAFVPADPGQYDLFAFGTEECEQTIEKAVLVSSKKKWEAKCSESLGEGFTLLKSQTLNAIHISVYVRTTLIPHIAYVQSQSVATGIGNVIGNKGGVAVSLNIGETSFLFVNCHFAAHQTKVKERNDDYHRINTELKLQAFGASRASRGAATDRFDRVFWFGDMNYRINGHRATIDACLEERMFEVLIANDQLTIQRARGLAFDGFEEASVHFKPTYKFDAGTTTYDTSQKQRVPAWTDRILFKPHGVVATMYTACDDVLYSDHLPVVASFSVKWMPVDGPVRVRPPPSSAGSSVCAVL